MLRSKEPLVHRIITARTNQATHSLRKNPQNLNMLKEKLFILWGNLEELKSASAAAPGNEVSKTPKTSSNSFECCIQEYGVLDGPDPGNIQNWKRVHRMFGTTVM